MNKLQLGCGDHAPKGWINTDGSWHVLLAKVPGMHKVLGKLGTFSVSTSGWAGDIRHVDLRKRLPFGDAQFEAIYSSHVLEHLHRDEALRLLQECFRCTKPGGVVRMAVPNLARYIEDYLAGVVSRRAPAASPADSFMERLMMRPPMAPRHKTPVHAFYEVKMDFNSHKWLYDEASLCQLFRDAGFAKPYRCAALESASPHMQEVERPERLGGDQTLIVEARREA
ncbi:MAG TPA: methyltransferase domain-containing protein [Ramlibacter sp.]|jgi:predicted SAM-dependent methyltransferase|nr:methyltransferase domain-containing protein [Ramlibacter sp.]